MSEEVLKGMRVLDAIKRGLTERRPRGNRVWGGVGGIRGGDMEMDKLGITERALARVKFEL